MTWDPIRTTVPTISCPAQQGYFVGSCSLGYFETNNKTKGIKEYPLPGTAQRVLIRPTDAAVADLDVDVDFLPLFWGEFLPDHFAIDCAGVEAHTPLELINGRSQLSR